MEESSTEKSWRIFFGRLEAEVELVWGYSSVYNSIGTVPETVRAFRIQRTLEEHGTDSDLFMRLLLQPIYSKPKNTFRASVYTLFLGRADQLPSILKRDFPELGLKKEDCIEMGWIESVIWWAN